MVLKWSYLVVFIDKFALTVWYITRYVSTDPNHLYSICLEVFVYRINDTKIFLELHI